MVSANGTRHNNGSNGVHARELYPACPSDYEAAPVIDITPTAPKPGWRDQHAAFAHHIQWADADGISHGLTLRSDSLSDLMSDIKLVKSMIRQAKSQASERAPQQAAQTQADGTSETEQADVQHCKLHAVDMIRRWSKRTNGHYFAHKTPDGNFCYGRERAKA